MRLSRRAFLRAGALALMSYGLDPMFLTRAAYAARRAGRGDRRTLVVLFQRGAVDGLNMVIPHGDPLYYRERPTIAVPQEQVIDLDGYFGLHPALAPLKPLWDERRLAAIHAIGSPDSTRSHFDAQDYMETGTPGVKNTPDGWLNRYCQHAREHADTPFRAVAFGPELPRILGGSAPALAVDDLRAFGIQPPREAVRDKLTRAFEALYASAPTSMLASTAGEGFAAAQMLRSIDAAHYVPGNGAQYPSGRFGQSLQQIAQLIKSDLGLEIAFADLGGWDTHVNQGGAQGQLANRLTELGQGLAAFARDLGDKMDDVVVLTMSEFGRTVKENGDVGTDHGHATVMFALGGGVHGGKVLGRWPGLAPEQRYEQRDLAVTTDFRDFFAEALDRHLGARDMGAIFPGVAHARFPGAFKG
jgi:uncharacterized protein (DUF1501 family)